MESIKKEVGSGLLMGIIGILLLGAIVTVLGMPLSAMTKLGKILFDIGVAGIAWIFLDETFEGEGSDIYRAALAIAAAIVVAFAW
ncbi:hypothetical protein [Thermococcus sp. Bubb.Bath]|uniref:hypothetical protein n=1 Tax=Thermococcus sp. Bubb.Bath TaxID=1638242 RepID=UPI001439F35F|nr:hypothetical protein [Thermococcus sp. Bubb.Bath]NJF26080.1 hypothetical protein [Thermococcus sp. Bubb.Bath]